MIAITMNEIRILSPSRHPLYLVNATMTNRRGRLTWDINLGVMERWMDMKLASADAVLWHHVQEVLSNVVSMQRQTQSSWWLSKASP